MKMKNTKRSLLLSALSLLLCVSVLIGSTFAWFTDSVTSANNIIKSGNLDVELYYQVEGQTDWTKVTEGTNVFMEDALWEPGHTEVVKLKVVNEGSLALKYQLGVNIASEAGSVNVYGDKFELSDFIKFGIVDGAQTYDREQAVAAVDATATTLKTAYNSGTTTLLVDDPATTDVKENEKIVTMVVYMPTTVGNEANYANGAAQPTINLGINLFATQVEFEQDSFGPDYDKDAWHEKFQVATAEELQRTIANANNGDIIVFANDIKDVDGALITDKEITIDLNGNTYTVSEGASTNNRNFKITGNSVVTIKNGTLVAEGTMTDGAYGTVRTEGAANVTLENVKLYSYRGYGLNVKAYAGTTITINDSEIYAKYSGGVEAAGGTIVLNNTKIEQNGVYSSAAWCSVAIGVNGNGKVTVNSGNYSAATIATDANAAQGTWVAYVMSSGGTLEINGGTFNGTVAETASAANACGIICADRAAVVNINGGVFNSNGAILDMRNNVGTQPNPVATLAGGVFSADPRVSGLYSSNLIKVADGYAIEAIGNGKYVVAKQEVNVASVATAAELQDALDNAANQNLIVLTADIAGDVTVKQIKDLVIIVDGNGHKFAGTFIVDGNSAQESTSGVTLKNIKFEADTVNADAIVRLGDGTGASRYTANVTVENCHFAVNGAVGIKSYTGGDINLKIIGCTTSTNLHSLAQLKGVKGVLVEDCTVTSVRGINFNNSDNITVKNSTVDVQKYALRYGSDENTNVENYTIIDCTLKSANVDNDAVVVLRAGATNANLTITNTTITGAIRMTGHENANVVIQ